MGKIESYGTWSKRISKTLDERMPKHMTKGNNNQKKDLEEILTTDDNSLQRYLKLVIDYVNASPAILNKEYTKDRSMSTARPVLGPHGEKCNMKPMIATSQSFSSHDLPVVEVSRPQFYGVPSTVYVTDNSEFDLSGGYSKRIEKTPTENLLEKYDNNKHGYGLLKSLYEAAMNKLKANNKSLSENNKRKINAHLQRL